MSRAARSSFLRADVRAEPLVDRWYAWSYLLFPPSAALYLANAHLPLLRSYLADPNAHAEAARGKLDLGAPVVAFDTIQTDAVRALLDRTLAEQTPLLELASGITELEHILGAEARGGSLDRVYERVPSALRGYVELVYDRENHPSMRFLEALLYKSPLYPRAGQGMSLSIVSGHRRPPALSTPRLPGEGVVELSLPFDAPFVDELFAMRRAPRRPEEMAERLGLDAGARERFSALLTDTAPRPVEAYAGPGIRARYFGHACVLLEWAGGNALVDPLINHRYESREPYFSFEDLPEVLYDVVITHGHEDHLHLETLIELRHKVRRVVVPKSGGGRLEDPSLRLLLRAAGFRDIVEVDDLDRLECAGGAITALPFMGEHGDLAIRSKAAYLVEGGGRKVLCMADSDNVEPRVYASVRAHVGPVDAMFLGMECEGSPLTSLYGPVLTTPLLAEHRESRRFRGSDCARALDLVARFEPSHVYVYAMGQEPWLYYLMSLEQGAESRPIVESNRLVEACRRRGLVAERLYCKKQVELP
ncbi:MBL fold metallo-hydrolase [Sorangium sp. So ce295]|jgi:L-ascorbate metabolism protein UlaG (beta-lactamase superfamily)|uniref:MBL fold metallo-hydrolase n=1 Tax=Sorangium sp. So ce295 TaxID=3133295 RepID=UPI003F623825